MDQNESQTLRRARSGAAESLLTPAFGLIGRLCARPVSFGRWLRLMGDLAPLLGRRWRRVVFRKACLE